MKIINVISFILVMLVAGPAWADCGRAQDLLDQAAGESVLSRRIELLDKATSLCPNFLTWYNLGKAYMEAKQYTLAVGAFKDAWKEAGDTVNGAFALNQAGYAHQKEGQVEDREKKPEKDKVHRIYAVSTYKQALALFRKLNKPAPKLVARLKNLELGQAKRGLSSKQITRALSFRNFKAESSLDLRILFEFREFVLTNKGVRDTDQLAKALIDPVFKGRSFVLTGHTDKRGSDELNLVLSQNRAKTVAKYLFDNYPDLKGRIRTQGEGEARLLYFGETEDEHRLNRRVEVKVTR